MVGKCSSSTKENRRVRVCVDYRDFNKAYTKNDFPLPHIDILIDHATLAVLLSTIDGFSKYNQVLMALMDKLKLPSLRNEGFTIIRSCLLT